MHCPHCGHLISEMELAAHRAKPPVEKAAAQPISAQEKECPRCGKATAANAAFCDKCGYKYQLDMSRAERYQAVLAEEARAALPSPVQRHQSSPHFISPFLSWGIVGVCVAATALGAWAMLRGATAAGSRPSSAISAEAPPSPNTVVVNTNVVRTVTYKVIGTMPRASVTYQRADDILVTLPSPVRLPWTYVITAKPGADLYLSVRPVDQQGPLLAEIDVDGFERKLSARPGPDGQIVVTDTL